MDKVYTRIIWVNQPSTTTAVGATNLNKMDYAINVHDDRIVAMDTTKANQSTVNGVVQSITYNDATGVLTITKVNGTSTTIDTKLEKLAVNFSYNPTTQQLDITLDDGTVQHVDMSALVTQYEFLDTDTVSFSLQPDGKIKASVIPGSITGEMLQPNFLADIIVQANIAVTNANLSKRYTVGGVESGDTTDNAKYYKEQAEIAAAEAEAIAGFNPLDYYKKIDVNAIIGDRSQLPTPNADLVSAVIGVNNSVNQNANQTSKKFNDKINNIISSGSGINPIDLHFDAVNINKTQNMKIPIYSNDFSQNIDNSYVDELATFKTHSQIKYVWTEKQLEFNCTGGATSDYQEIYIVSPAIVETSNFVCEVDVDYDYGITDGTATSVRVGIMKDMNNFCIANYDKLSQVMQIVGFVNGNIFATNFTYVAYEAPYTLMMLAQNDYAVMIIKKNGVYHYIGETNVGASLSFNNPSILQNWHLCFGCRASNVTKSVKISNLKSYYTTGMSVGSDYHVLTYEDGCAIKNNNSLYFTATTHSVESLAACASGISIFKLGLNNYNLEYVAHLCFKDSSSSSSFGGGSSKIFYDRRINKWVMQATNFKVNPCKTYIGVTERNLLSGIHVIDMQVMNIPDQSIATWDFDIIFDSSVNKYRCIYAKNVTGGVTLCESTDVLGTWTTVSENLSVAGEGSMFFKCNGKYYISKTNTSNLGLDLLSYPSLTVLGITITNKWCNKGSNSPNSWGQIISLNNGTDTNFYMLVFSGNKWEGKLFSYGDLWIYKAREKETGIEFIENSIIQF